MVFTSYYYYFEEILTNSQNVWMNKFIYLKIWKDQRRGTLNKIKLNAKDTAAPVFLLV